MVTEDRPSDAAALAWLVSVGADEAIADEPVDRFRAAPAVAKSAAFPPPPSLLPQGGGIRMDGDGMGLAGPDASPSHLPSEALPLDGGGLGGGGTPIARPDIPLGTSEGIAT